MVEAVLTNESIEGCHTVQLFSGLKRLSLDRRARKLIECDKLNDTRL